MTRKKPIEWIRLDNAAKIFPPTTNEKDTKVFRFICELNEQVDKDILQQALDKTMIHFPLYRTILRKGVFWYYFESTDLTPEVKEEYKLPCSMLYNQNRRNLLFEVTYYKNRVNLEIYHALTDGTGALAFLKTLIYYYLTIKYAADFAEGLPNLDYDATMSQKMDDSFIKHYTGSPKSRKIKLRKAYKITGRRSIDNRLKVIEGVMSAKEVINLAHKYETTLTIYLVAIFIYSIYQEMPDRSRRYPIVISVPVNLRAYFPSVTARNFFGTINVSYDFSKGDGSLDDIIRKIKDDFSQALTTEKLRVQMNRLIALEKNAFARVAPLFFKDMVLRIANSINDRGITAAFSNIGKVKMDKIFSPYIRLFNCFVSARRPQIAMCSFEDRLVISFASPFIGTDIQKNFFRILSEQGIMIAIASNVKEL